MWNLGRNRDECREVRDSLERSTGPAGLAGAVRNHLAGCADCRAVADELFESRALLRKAPQPWVEPSPWFTARVMAAIAARESGLQRSFEAWTVVPKFAARLTWISALALLLAGTWLYESPKPAPKSGNESGVETLFDVSPTSASQDDVLVSFERGQ